MPLRSPNNPSNSAAILASLKNYALGFPTPNTALALNSSDGTGQSVFYVQREYDMFQNNVFPAVLAYSGTASYGRMSQRTFNGQQTFYLDYYNTYVSQNAEFDTIRAEIEADMLLMLSNIEANDTLPVGGLALTICLLKSTLSGYDGSIIRDVNNVKYVYQKMSLVFNILDYDTLG
jgi:hypothetical protein